MKGRTREKSSKFDKLVLALCEIIIGTLLLINPISFTKAIITVLGVLLLVPGVMSIVRYFKKPPQEAAMDQDLTMGIMQIIAGIFCMLKSGWLIAAFPLLTALYGVITLIAGVRKVQWTIDCFRLKANLWFWEAISAAITLICAVFILCNPLASVAAMWIFIGVTLIVEAIFDALTMFFVK
jgi:uncharacterized membrane protein HdeD (DUF308 family)